jgi:uncharacterized membrane protein YcfT
VFVASARGIRPAMTHEAPPVERLAWLDVAKGLCILLVVLHHVTSKYVLVVLPPDLAPVGEAWFALNQVLRPLRMPVFFAISGFFAARAVHRPWRLSRTRVASPYYLYAVWSLVYVVVYAVETDMAANRTTSVGELVGELVWASTSAWFLFALAAYFLVAKALAGLPPVPVLLAAGALAVATGWMDIEHTNRVSVLTHLGFFLLGAYFPDRVRWWAERPGRVVLALAGGYAAVFGSTAALGLPRSVTLIAASAVGVPLGLALARRVAEHALVAVPLAWLGRRTLRIYVLHLAVLAVVFHLPLDRIPLGPERVLVALVLPLLVTGVVTAACLVVHAVLVRLGAGWLFALPARTSPTGGRVHGAARRGRMGAQSGQLITGRIAADPWTVDDVHRFTLGRQVPK